MTAYTLHSTPFCCTPGVIRWAQNGAKFKKDRPALAKVIASAFPQLPWLAVEKILDGDCVIDDTAETVTVTVDLDLAEAV